VRRVHAALRWFALADLSAPVQSHSSSTLPQWFALHRPRWV